MILLLALFVPSALGQALTIYAIPPKKPLNWESPQALMLSYAANLIGKTRYKGRRHAMGHVVIELKSGEQHAIAGMIAESKANMYSRVAVQGYGLGVVFEKIEGRLEQGSDLGSEIEARCRNGDVAWLKFMVSEEAFTRLWQYFEEYQARGYDKIYNGENKPREGTGAGCSAFAVSFLELAGLMTEEEMCEWQKTIYIPQSLIGYREEKSRKRIPPLNILLKRTWADTASQLYKSITYYEPGMMYRWILKDWADKTACVDHASHRAVVGKAKGVIRDCIRYPVPSDPIWKDNNAAPHLAWPLIALPGPHKALHR